MTHDGLPSKEVIPGVSLAIIHTRKPSRRMLSFARFPLGEDGNKVALSQGRINLR